jgi:hypothetical protein
MMGMRVAGGLVDDRKARGDVAIGLIVSFSAEAVA